MKFQNEYTQKSTILYPGCWIHGYSGKVKWKKKSAVCNHSLKRIVLKTPLRNVERIYALVPVARLFFPVLFFNQL